MEDRQETLRELQKQKALLQARVKLYREQLSSGTKSVDKATLQAKITAYQAALRDVQVQIGHIKPKAPPKRKRTLQVGGIAGGMADFWSLGYEGAAADLAGRTPDQIRTGEFVQTGENMEQLQRWRQERAELWTERQRTYLDEYYNEGLTMLEIAAAFCVDRSTISRVIESGMTKMQDWVRARKLGETYTRESGQFDWVNYIKDLPPSVLTDRQKQLLLLILSGRFKSQSALAEKLGLQGSSVSRTLKMARAAIQAMGVRGKPVTRPMLRNFSQADQLDLSLQLGMPLNFIYRYCFPGQKIHGMNRYRYEMARRYQAGQSAEETAQEFGMRVRTVREAYIKARKAPPLSNDAVLPACTKGEVRDAGT